MDKGTTEAERLYNERLQGALPTKNVGKYSLDRSKMTRIYSLNKRSYLYQRVRVPADKRYSVAYGIVEAGEASDWFYWYDEAIVTLEGRAKFTVSYRPQFDVEEVYEVGPTDIFFVEKGTKVLWEALDGKPHIYMIVAIPAAAKS
jgi:uncharacterized cupin superfamily protein